MVDAAFRVGKTQSARDLLNDGFATAHGSHWNDVIPKLEGKTITMIGIVYAF